MKEKWYLKTWLICLLFAFWFLYGVPLILGIILIILKNRFDKQYQQEYVTLSNRCEYMETLLTPEMQDTLKLQELVSSLKKEQSIIENRISSTQNELNKLESEIKSKKNQIISMDEEILVQEFGLYKPKYEFSNSDLYKDRLNDIRAQQKQLIKDKEAATGSTEWTVNGNKSQGKKMVSDMQKLLLRAFNCECDELIAKVKYNNFDASLKRITASRDAISKLGTVMNVSITSAYYNLKVQELQLALEYQIKKQAEKEALKEARAELREQARLQKEIEEQRKKIEKEQSHYQHALQTILKQLDDPVNENNADLLQKKSEIESQLGIITTSLKDIDYREANQRAGYVYVISNVGSFGENVYKIGMTRRLEPMDRVDELGDASVPFNFDVHAMIFTDDAPKLENALHKAFEDKKINMVNQRREFFRVSLEEIKDVIRKNYDKTVEFIDVPEANQYRISEKMRASQ